MSEFHHFSSKTEATYNKGDKNTGSAINTVQGAPGLARLRIKNLTGSLFSQRWSSTRLDEGMRSVERLLRKHSFPRLSASKKGISVN